MGLAVGGEKNIRRPTLTFAPGSVVLRTTLWIEV
jgi:hypothetical protein